MSEKAKTYDDGKEPLAHLPWAAMRLIARVQAYGERKYKDFYNYRKGMEVSRNVSCALRHLTSWQDGQNLDPESGESHLGHALTRISYIVQNQEDGTAIDDRFSSRAAKQEHVPTGRMALEPAECAPDALAAHVKMEREAHCEPLPTPECLIPPFNDIGIAESKPQHATVSIGDYGRDVKTGRIGLQYHWDNGVTLLMFDWSSAYGIVEQRVGLAKALHRGL